MRRARANLEERLDRNQARAGFEGTGAGAGADFPCAELCSTCGYFLGPDATDPPADGTCPSCGESGWLDLGLDANAERLRKMEADERQTAPAWIRRTLLGLVIVTGVMSAVAGLMIVRNATLFLSSVIGTFIALPLAYYLLPRPLSVWLLQGRQESPHRWHVPLPLPDPDAVPDRTYEESREATPAGETLTAPISQQECIAYQVCVLFDVEGDARPPEWALQEQRAAPARFGDDLELDPDTMFLETPVEEVETPDAVRASREDLEQQTDGASYEELEQFLRQRGLAMTDGEFHFYEARLEAGDRVDVADHDSEMFTIRHTSAAPADDLPDLPHPASDGG
jgi:hypothetical protein